MADNEKYVNRIALLLAKAESTTPAEAEALTEAAEKLMLKYGIEQAVIDARRAQEGGEPERIVECKMYFTGAYALDLIDLGVNVAHALGSMRTLQSRGQDEWGRAAQVLYIIGFESDVAQAQLLISSLEMQAAVAMRAWWKEQRPGFIRAGYSGAEQRKARSSFVRGFGIGARARISSNKRTIIQEAGTGTELVLVSRQQKVDEVVDSVKRGKARKRQEADGYGFYNGRQAGLEANTGDRGLTNGKAIAS